MSTRRPEIKRRLLEYLAERKPPVIGEAEWVELTELLGPVSAHYLRSLLLASGVPIAQPFAGVRQESEEQLERSLLEIGELYRDATNAGNASLARQCRRIVIQSKDHARLAARNPKLSPEGRARKGEMVDWMLVWLSDPSLFPEWVKLRKRARDASPNLVTESARS